MAELCQSVGKRELIENGSGSLLLLNIVQVWYNRGDKEEGVMLDVHGLWILISCLFLLVCLWAEFEAKRSLILEPDNHVTAFQFIPLPDLFCVAGVMFLAGVFVWPLEGVKIAGTYGGLHLVVLCMARQLALREEDPL